MLLKITDLRSRDLWPCCGNDEFMNMFLYEYIIYNIYCVHIHKNAARYIYTYEYSHYITAILVLLMFPMESSKNNI